MRMTSQWSPSHTLPPRPARPRWVGVLLIVLAVHLVVLLVWICGCPRRADPKTDNAPPSAAIDPLAPVREAPAAFARNACLPDVREVDASGAIDLTTFSPGRDLIYLDDARVWWESDEDGVHDDECDHSMHGAMELPLRRLIELATTRQGRLKVQDAFRPTGIHNPRSLHREGRAIDLTSDDIPLDELAKMCWQAGFDWVFYECPKNGGHHVHASVRRSAMPPFTATAAVQQ